MAQVSLKNVSKIFPGGIKAVDNINLGNGQTNISGAGGVNLGAPIIKLNS